MVHRETAPEQSPVELEKHAAAFVLIAQRLELLGERDVDTLLLRVGGEINRVQAAPSERFAASPAREDEVDGGEHGATAQHLDDLEQVVVRRATRLAKPWLLHGVSLGELERAARRVAGRVEQWMHRVVAGEPHLARQRTLGA